jgi:hypothetical protein
MKDNVEDFIRQNRNGFDDKEPSDKVWAGIERNLFATWSLWNSVTLWRAAAVIFMVLSIYLLIPKEKLGQNAVALREFNDVESFYIKEISNKVKLIDEIQKSDIGLNGFTHDFQQLEAMYLVLKDEMKNDPSQKVKDALVLNLLVRIDLLNQQLYRLDKEYTSKGGEKQVEQADGEV